MNTTFDAQIWRVAVNAHTEAGGNIRRGCTLTLAREFDDEIAEAIGPAAQLQKQAFDGGDTRDAVLVIDAVTVSMNIECVEADGRKRSVDFVAQGETAKIKAGKGDTPTTVKMRWAFDFNEEALLFLARNSAGSARVAVSPAQLALGASRSPASNEGEKQEAPKRGRRKAAAESTDPATVQ